MFRSLNFGTPTPANAMMIRIFITLLLSVAACATMAAEIQTPDAIVSMTVPDDFRALSAEEIHRKWPTGSPPSFVVGNATQSTTIAYDLKADALAPNGLAQALRSFEEVFSRAVPGIEWKRHEIVELVGREWMLLEFMSNAVDTDIHNIMLVTSHDGRMLTLNFNSTRGEFAQMEDALRQSVASIRVNPR